MPLDWWLSRARELAHHLDHTPPDCWLLFRWAAQSLAGTLLILAADALLGASLLRAFRCRLPVRLRGAVALTIGGGAAGLLIFILGILRRIDAGWVLGVTGLAALPGLWMLRTAKGRWQAFGWLSALRPRGGWWVVAGLFLGLQTLDWLMPVLDYDATMYHAASAKWYEDTRRMPYHEGIRFNAQPHLPSLLYLRQLLLLDDQRIKLINLEFALVILLVVAHAARRRRWPVPVAFALVGLSPVFWWITRIEYADFAMAAWFTAGAALLLLDAQRRPWLAGLALGLAGAAKLQGLVMAALLGGSWVIGAGRWRAIPALAAGVCAAGLPWWIRSWRHTGSPMFPFFTDSPDGARLFEVSARYGVGRDALAFLRLPWDAMTADARVFADPYIFGPGLAMFAGLLVARLVRRAAPSRMALISIAAFGLYLVFWFRTGQVMRYLAAWVPFLILAAMLWMRGGTRLKWLQLPLLTGASFCSLYTLTTVRYASLPPVTTLERETLLANHLPYYASARELRRVIGPREKTYLLFCEESRFYVPGLVFGDWFGAYSYRWAGTVTSGPAAVVRQLREAGFHYLLVDRDRARAGAQLYSAEFQQSGIVRSGGPLPDGLQQIYTDGRYVLWKIQ